WRDATRESLISTCLGAAPPKAAYGMVPPASAAVPPPESVDSCLMEFELTLDDSGPLPPRGGPASSQVRGGAREDIFETDFEVPALEEESGSEAVALDDADTNLDSSDFDLALDEKDAAAKDESGSQVVALDEETDGEAAAKQQAPTRKQKPPP